ncbi:MAG: 23S rRNA (uracil(1939)-C(5))-methyltransferase RlmD [Candidatus Izemoplasmatales bacterium]
MNILNIGDKVKLDIRKQGINGEGIGYYNKLAIFVPGAILKETINVEITDVKPNFALGKIDSIERSSTKRVVPPCKFYELCGGCQMQHIDYTEQLKIKQSILVQSLRKYTPSLNADQLVEKTLGMKDGYGYRNKSQMPFRNLNFGLALGLYQPGTNHFVFVDECAVQHPMINQINKQALQVLRKHKMMAHDTLNKEGILLHLVVRYLEVTNEASVTFIVTKYVDELKLIAKELAQKNDVIKSVSYSINRRNSNIIFGSDVKFLIGSEKIHDKVDDLDIAMSPDAFHQLNSLQMNVLYKELLKRAGLTGKETVIDCYSGIGITTLQLAKVAKKVYGIDYSEASIENAKENAKRNHITNTEMYADHVEGALPKILGTGVKADLIVLDPPRTGLDQSVIKAIKNAKIKKILYVSCNPSTLAKNFAELMPEYQVNSILPIDMFPHTASVESITLLERK